MCVHQKHDIVHKNRFSNIHISMFFTKKSQFTCLKGKAAEIRNLAKPLLDVFSMFMDDSNRIHKLILLGLQLSVRFEQLLDSHLGFYVMPPEVSRELITCSFGFCQSVTALAQHFHNLNPGVLVYNYTPKFHYLLHVGLMSRYCNPARLWCYSGEALMEKVKTITHACVFGISSEKALPKAMDKYCCGLSLMLSKL